MSSIAIPATVSVRVGVEWVHYAQIEMSEHGVVHETNSPFCEEDERGIVCE